MMCEYYALCRNEADGVTTHPVLELVPTCKRCADRHSLTLWTVHAATQQGPLCGDPDGNAVTEGDDAYVTCFACLSIALAEAVSAGTWDDLHTLATRVLARKPQPAQTS